MNFAVINLMIVIIAMSIFIFLLAFMAMHFFSPNNKIKKNRIEYEEKLENIKQLFSLYEEYNKNEKKQHPCIMNARLQACLGTNKYDYRLIFLLLKNNFSSPEVSAKFIMNAWPILTIKYNNHEILLKHWFKIKNIKLFNNTLLIIYIICSLFIISLVGGAYQFFTSKQLSLLLFIAIIAIFLCLWFGGRFTTILSIEKLFNNDNDELR